MVSTYRPPLSIKFDQKKSFSSPFEDLLHLISFKFTCESHSSEWVFAGNSEVPRRLKKTNLPLIETFVFVTRSQLACSEKAREILSKKLGNWDVEPDELRKLIDQALGKAREMVRRMPPHHNSVHLTYRVKDTKLCIFDEVEEKGRAGSVPSFQIESTIESLEKLILS